MTSSQPLPGRPASKIKGVRSTGSHPFYRSDQCWQTKLSRLFHEVLGAQINPGFPSRHLPKKNDNYWKWGLYSQSVHPMRAFLSQPPYALHNLMKIGFLLVEGCFKRKCAPCSWKSELWAGKAAALPDKAGTTGTSRAVTITSHEQTHLPCLHVSE